MLPTTKPKTREINNNQLNQVNHELKKSFSFSTGTLLLKSFPHEYNAYHSSILPTFLYSFHTHTHKRGKKVNHNLNHCHRLLSFGKKYLKKSFPINKKNSLYLLIYLGESQLIIFGSLHPKESSEL